VNWQDFNIQPTQFGSVVNYYAQLYPESSKKFNLIDYKKDQWSVKLGLAHIFSDRFTGTSDFAWDSGSGNPAGTLNPSDGYYAFGLGILYHLNKDSFIAYGTKYFQFNKTKIGRLDLNNPINQNSTLASISNNYAFAHGIKIAYRF